MLLVVLLWLIAGCGLRAKNGSTTLIQRSHCAPLEPMTTAAGRTAPIVSEKAMKKLDLSLSEDYRRLVQSSALARSAPLEPANMAARDAASEIHVTVHFLGNASDLEAAGLKITSFTEVTSPRVYKFAWGSICLARLGELAEIDHVVFVEQPQSISGQLNYSAPDIHALAFGLNNEKLTGKGVIVAIIDSGIEWRHGGFIKDGKTRILEIWDHVFNVKYSRQQIQQALEGKLDLQTEDLEDYGSRRKGHGTHVAGIAAGDGSPGNCCEDGNKYIGIAPEADLLIVRLDSRVLIPDALNYIRNHKEVVGTPPAVPGRPVVVNISLGISEGPHDGTHPWEAKIDEFVKSGPGRIVVVSAGNNGGRSRHIMISVPSTQSREIVFVSKANDRRRRNVDLWYFNGSQLDMEVVGPDGTASGVSKHGDPNEKIFTVTVDFGIQRVVRFQHFLNLGPYQDHRIRMQLKELARAPTKDNEWKLRVSNPYPTNVDLHCWIEDDDLAAPIFTAPENAIVETTTLSTPATAKEAIAVGSYDSSPSGKIAFDTGRGPVRQDASINPKPTIAAPGVDITSANADSAKFTSCCSCCPDSCCCLYVDHSGTSQAAPHVTGAIALMLQVDGTLSKDDIVGYLKKSALLPSGADSNQWGVGKINVAEAVRLLKADRQGSSGGTTVTASLANARVARSAHSPEFRMGTTPEEDGGAVFGALPPMAKILHARARAIPGGELCAALISRHFSEVRRLINTNTRVATMWHRGEGPKMLRRFLQGSVDESAEPPVRNETQREYLSRFFDQLVRFGSSRLRASITTNGEAIMHLLKRPLAAQVVAQGDARA